MVEEKFDRDPKLLLFLTSKRQNTLTSDDYWRNKIYNIFCFDAVDDVCANLKAVHKHFILSFLTWFPIGIFLMHPSVLMI